ncbi:unnamed protein product [Cyclocybe aegerita]|uniref:F-box domain-containing protein n=1 Tax=Cyclocybe aegerita TaxID=1973307 RepID=A0A8S0VZY2_CYCAE|nr:unnamed protein product [Cyclocybe aegerita]
MLSASRTLVKQYALRIPILSNLVGIKPTGLVALPLEISIEIMKGLEWDDILRVRQTCKYLCEVSKARPVWQSLFVKYSQSISPPQPFRPDKPIQNYSSRELETVVLRWKAAEVGWLVDGRVPLRERPLFMEGEFTGECMHLVRGGRWLLVVAPNGSVEYYDLDVSQPISHSLIPPPFEEHVRVRAFMSVDMSPMLDGDEDGQNLTFHLGLCLQRFRDLDPETLERVSPSRQNIQIWRVAFRDKEGSSIEGLFANCLSSFPEESIADTEAFDLRGRYVAYSAQFYRGVGVACSVVVDWSSANGTNMAYKRKYLSGAQGVKLSLLPGDRLFTSYSESMRLYDLLSAPESVRPPSQHEFPHERPIWKTELRAFESDFVSGPFFIHDSSRFVMMDEHGLRGLIIPDADFIDSEGGPTMLLLLKDENSKSQHPHVFGYHRGMGVYLDDIILPQYLWPDEQGKEGIAHAILSPSPHSVRVICMDEYSGRAAITLSNFKDHCIIDFPIVSGVH